MRSVVQTINERQEHKLLQERIAELDQLAQRGQIDKCAFEACLAVASFQAGVITYKRLLNSYKKK